MDTSPNNDIAARIHYFNLEKRIKIQLDYIDSLKLPNHIYQSAIFQLYNEIFLNYAQYKILEINIDNSTGTYISDDKGFRLDEKEYPSLCRIVREKTNFYEEMDKNDDKIELIDKMLFFDKKQPTKTQLSYERLTLDELFKLELYDFFDYCRHGDGIPDLYILKYLEKYSEGFKPELVRLIWHDFWPYFEAEKQEFYEDQDRIEAAIKGFKEAGLELPLYPDIEYTPPVRKEDKTDEQYAKICEMAKQCHDAKRGALNVKKLLSTDSVELCHLFKIESLLKQKMNIPIIDDKNPLVDECTASKSCTISRDAVGFLFRELRNKGIVKSITDTELAEYIEGLTGYSKEKIRQNIQMTDIAKSNLRSLLLSIVDKLK